MMVHSEMQARRYHYPKDPSQVDPWIYVEQVDQYFAGLDIS